MTQNTSHVEASVRLSPVSYVVLGIIGLRGPSTPYQLKQAIERSVRYFWPFPHSQLYGEPERLSREGLLDQEVEGGGAPPPRLFIDIQRSGSAGELVENPAGGSVRDAGYGGVAALFQ